MANEPNVSADTIRKLSSPKQIERNNGSEALEHTLRRRMRRVGQQAWIPDTSHQRVHLKPFCKHHGCLLSPL